MNIGMTNFIKISVFIVEIIIIIETAIKVKTKCFVKNEFEFQKSLDGRPFTGIAVIISEVRRDPRY